MIKHLVKETLIGFLLAGITSSTLFSSLLLPIPQAQAAANMCQAADPNAEPVIKFWPGKDGGVKLDQAAEFIADMSDLTGAYYDEGRDQIVFVGTKETTIPKFDKDDLAVAIRSIFFAEANPGLKIEYKAPEDFENGKAFTNNDGMNVNYMPSKYGDKGPNEGEFWTDDQGNIRPVSLYGIEDTAFAKILFDADWKLKQYWLGYGKEHTDGGIPEKLRSNVPGYASFFDRYGAKGASDSQKSVMRVWLRPQKITLKLDETEDAFVFDQVKMELVTEHFFGENKDANWAAAAVEFAAHHTDNYDAFAAETPAYDQVKRLAKIVSVVKWLKDNNITTDFHWARHFEPAYVPTPRGTKMIVGGDSSNLVAGSLSFPSQNVYSPGGGAGASLKDSALASQPTPADFHWNFTNNGQSLEAVAVSADIFRNAGAYSSGATDLSLPTLGDTPLAFTRTYSSQMNERTYVSNTSLGKGWEALPARLNDIDLTGASPACGVANQPSQLSFETQGGAYETFTFSCTTNTYQADNPFDTSKLTKNADDTYTVTRKDLSAYTFDRLTRFYGEIFRIRSISDRNGNTIHYDYREPSANLYRIYDDHGQYLEVNFGDFQRVKDVTDHTGRSVKYAYDSVGRLIQVTDIAGRTTQYNYDGDNRLTAITDPAGQNVMQAAYNELNKITAQTDALGKTVNVTYDETARTLTAHDSTGASEINIYDADSRLLESVDPLGKSTKYTYGTFRSPETVTDKRGNVTKYQYDARGNVTKVTAPDNLSLDTTYNTADLPTQITDGRYTPSRATTLTYDDNFNLTKQDTAGISTQAAYDSVGQVQQVTGPSGQTNTYQYNSLGLPTAVTDALGNTTTYEYDSLGRVTKQTDPAGIATTFTYDTAGRLLTTTDSAGTTSYTYDSLDRLTKVTLPDGTVAQYTYNSANQVSKVTDAKGNSTTYAYDTKGNLLSRKTAVGTEYKSEYDALSRPTKASTPLGKTNQSSYDANGNATQLIDAANKIVNQEFDNLNRPTKSVFSDQTNISRTFDGRGNVTAASDPAGQLALTYDIFDRLTQSKDPFGNAVNYTYDASSRRTSLTYPSGQKVNYAYDANNQLTSVTDWNNQAAQFSYHPNGLVKEKKLPNAITIKYDYDAANRLSRLTNVDSSGNVLAQTDIERSKVGNITRLIESGPFFDQAIGAPNPTPTPTPVPSSSPTPPPPPPPPSDDLAFILQTDEAWGIDVGSNATPALADLDSDGKLDLLVGEYSGNINHYEQTGTSLTDPFALITSSFAGIDIGIYSAPALTDIDADSDLDLFVGKSDGTLAFYQNNGTAQAATFQLQASKFQSIDIGSNSAPAFTDIDGDSDLDLFIGKSDGTLAYYRNDGTSQNPNFQLQDSKFNAIDIGSYSTPFFADFDKDQDLDLVIGTSDGKIKYYQNTGTPQTATFTLVSTIVSNIDVGSRSAPIAHDLTGDGLLDLLIGDSTGRLELWKNTTGSATAALPDTMFFGLIPITNAQTIDEFLQGHWKLEEDGGTRSDSSPNANHLSDNNTVASSTEHKEGAKSADLERDNAEFLSITDSTQTGLDPAAGLTLAFWAKRESTGGAHILLQKYVETGSQRSYSTNFRPDNDRLNFTINPDGVNDVAVNSNTAFAADTWYHLAAVFEPSTALKIYVNGLLDASNTAGIPGSIFNSTAPFHVGASSEGPASGNAFDGLLDDVRVYSKALTASEIAALAQSTGGDGGGGGTPAGGVTTFTYDALGQLVKAIYPDSQAFDYAYDPIGNRVGGTYDADAKLLSTGGVSYTYDDNGAMTEKTDSSTGSEQAAYYTTNPRHELSRVGKEAAPPETWELAYAKQTDSAWGFDVGSNSAPIIADLDADGQLDLLVGEYSGNINHYEQTEAKANAVFKLVTEKLANIDIGSYSTPDLVDIDGDSDLDLFIGKSDGTIAYYKNTGTKTSPALVLSVAKFSNIDIGSDSTPRFADIDADGDFDLFIGKSNGEIAYYKNTGSKTSPTLTLQAAKYNNWDVGSDSAPVFFDVDGDSDLDLFIGKSDGKISYYKNNGTKETPNYSLQTTTYQAIDVGYSSLPIFQDLTGDNLADILSGESTGKLRLYNATKKVTSGPDPGTVFKYDAFGNRIAKKTNGNETRYVNDVTGELPYVLAEFNSSNQPQSLYLYAGGLTSMGGVASTSRIYPLTDPTGNIRFLTDSSGNLVARYSYDPYGNVRKKEGTVNSAFTFSGEQFDPETSLTFLRARYYDPSTGTFLARDPVLGPLDTPIEHGEYLYARNNPVNLSDPSGLATYRQNRRLGHPDLRSNDDPRTHTFLFTTKSDGAREHTYSWGNEDIWWDTWHVDHPNDKAAADAALAQSRGLKKVGSDELDPYIHQVYLDWKGHWLHTHPNLGLGSNCKQEADLLLIEAKRRMREDNNMLMSRNH